ncbi:GNAT family N-acetyltransferase [Streptomyces sp. NPDC002838]|uniref:GNAT family N-acetyltransferase n=1 Tax=Streptomyces sp. NPDC002838 TaxID=3154436 RepID=UPI003319DC9B
MPPADASADAGTAPVADIGTDTSPGAGENRTDTLVGLGQDNEDTLDLRLPDELLALIEDERTGSLAARARDDGMAPPAFGVSPADDLLDRVADWGPTTTPAGVFHLVPVRVERDLPLVSRWMNDPAVAAFWNLAGPPSITEEHLRAQFTADGRSVPCLGMLEGTPMSYWEIYRADLDPLARHYPARPHDTGIHVLTGGLADRGRGLGSALLRAVADLVLDRRSACARVVAEPDLRNIPSIAAFLGAGFRFSAEVDLPAKRAALMVRDRSLRHLL